MGAKGGNSIPIAGCGSNQAPVLVASSGPYLSRMVSVSSRRAKKWTGRTTRRFGSPGKSLLELELGARGLVNAIPLFVSVRWPADRQP